MMRSQPQSIVMFGIIRGQGVNFTTPFVEKLKGQVAQAADAENSGSIWRRQAELHHCIEDGEPRAKQRTRRL